MQLYTKTPWNYAGKNSPNGLVPLMGADSRVVCYVDPTQNKIADSLLLATAPLMFELLRKARFELTGELRADVEEIIARIQTIY